VHVISVNVGLPHEVSRNGLTILTSIYKDPVAGPVKIEPLNLVGDRQSDLTVHGGVDKAVYAYPSEHYEHWRREFPDMPLPWGSFGENLSTAGLGEELYIGDCFRVGSAILQVTQPRMPCYKLAFRFNRDDMIKRFLGSGRSGFYFRVIEQGSVEAGSVIDLIEKDPYKVRVSDIQRLYLGQTSDPDLLRRVEELSALPQNWKESLQRRAQERAHQGA
jgi:MOSC domain-containing protein YiiM